MSTQMLSFLRFSTIARSFGLFVVLLLLGTSGILAEVGLLPIDETRIMYPDEWGVAGSAGLAYSTDLVQFFSLDLGQEAESEPDSTTVVAFTPYEDLVASTALPAIVADASNFTFDDSANRLLLLNRELTELVQVKMGNNGVLDLATEVHFPIGDVGLQSANGMAVDVEGTALFILDSTASHIVRLVLEADLGQATFATVTLSPNLDPTNLRGIALDPANRHLYLLHPNRQILYELSQAGNVIAEYDLSTLPLKHPRALVFAPSPDLTDEPHIVHLFIADGGPLERQDSQQNFPYDLYLSLLTTNSTGDGLQHPVSKIVEVSLDVDTVASVASINVVSLTLVQIIDLSLLDPPIPDPSGFEYIEATGDFLITDAEVEEPVNGNPPVYFEGANLFGVEVPTSIVITPTLSYTGLTTFFSSEPVGIAYNPDNGHVFVSDDNRKEVFEIDPGSDGIVNDGDTIVASFDTDVFDCMDPEGIDYDHVSGDLFISDGLNSELYRVSPGANGIFNGVPPAGDDVIVTQFDTLGLGIQDPESVFVNATGNLIFVSNHTEEFMWEVTTAGVLVQTFDISAANADNPSGVVMAPGSTNPGVLNYYITDRMEDNNSDPLANDGLIYEFSPPQGSGDLIFVSSTSGGKAGSVRFADEDVLLYDNGTWAMYFDGSDVLPTAADVDVFSLLDDGSFLLSFTAEVNVGTLGLVDDSDIVRFIPTSLGTDTAGTFEWYFNGSDVELTVNAEDIDTSTVLTDGRLVLSTLGNPAVTGVSGVKDEDLLLFTPTQLGATISGTWSLYFDGSDVGLADAASEDVNGVWLDPVNSDIYLTTLGLFTVNGLSGDAADIFICDPGSIGSTTGCAFRSYWDGSANGFGGEVIDAISIDRGTGLVSSAMLAALQAVEHTGEGDDPNADPDEGPDDVDEPDYHLFLPQAHE